MTTDFFPQTSNYPLFQKACGCSICKSWNILPNWPVHGHSQFLFINGATGALGFAHIRFAVFIFKRICMETIFHSIPHHPLFIKTIFQGKCLQLSCCCMTFKTVCPALLQRTKMVFAVFKKEQSSNSIETFPTWYIPIVKYSRLNLRTL